MSEISRSKVYTSIALPPFIILIFFCFIGYNMSNFPKSGMEELSYWWRWFVNVPAMLIISILGNCLLLFAVKMIDKLLKRKNSLDFINYFSMGMFIPIVVNIYFWVNIDELVGADMLLFIP